MFCEVFLKHLTSSILLREDDSGTIRMELNRVSILNHTPNTESKYLHALQPLRAAGPFFVFVCLDNCLKFSKIKLFSVE
jgi:hypothetical protein